MFVLTAENFKGESMRLTQNPDYAVISVTGLAPPEAGINTATNATFDGAVFKSSRVRERNIVMQIVIQGDIEANRLALYRLFPPKKGVKLYVQNSSRDVYIEGYVESLEVNHFDRRQTAQVSILCPRPFFLDSAGTEADMSNVIALFEFPFSIPEEGIEFSVMEANAEREIVNAGEVSSGMVIRFRAVGSASNPTLYNVDTSEFVKVNASMVDGDIITVDTRKGEKSILKDVDGVVTNIINSFAPGSSWLQLEVGSNVFLFTADSYPENIVCSISFENQYLGV